jgi:hypothetical protein
MDYYYSLLESYQQLKRRTFKLSLREQEGEQDLAAVANDIVGVLGQLRNNEEGHKEEGLGNAKNLTAQVTKGKGVQVTGGNLGGWGLQFSGQQIGGFGNAWQKQNSKANRLVQAWASSGQGAEGEEGGEQDQTQDQEVQENPLEGEAQRLQDELFGTEEKEGLFTRNEAGEVEPSIYFPGYVDAKRQSRMGKTINAVQKKEAGEEQGVGIRGAAAEDTSITDKLLASPNLDPERAAKALGTVQNTLNVVKDIHRGEDIPPDNLREVANNVQVTPQGVMFNGVYIQYRSDSKPENDMYRNATDQINKKIKEHNKECPDKGTEAGKDCHIKEIKAPSTGGRGMDLSKRGPMMEHSTVLTQLAGSLENCGAAGDKERCKKLEARIDEEFEVMLGNGSMEEAKRMFQEGLCAAGQACLVSIEGADAAVMTELTINYLVEEQGMNETTAATLVEKASQMEDGGTRAMVLLVASTRGFNGYTRDLDVVDSEVFGGEGSDLKGQKDDVRITVTSESFEKWKEKIGGQMSKVERDIEHAAKCAGEGVGLENLGKSQISEAEGDEGNVTFGVEQKARTSTTKGRTKMGEGNTNRVGKICKDTEGLDPLEQQFLEANDRRMEACAGKNKKSFDGMSAKDAACSFQEKIDDRMKAWNSLASGQPVLDSEGKAVEGAAAEMVRTWHQSKSANDKKAKERAKLATAGFNAMPNATTEQREAIKKIGLELEQVEISRELDKHTDSSGKVTGEGLGYLLQRTGQDSGSLDECVKDVRGYGDNTQRLGLINATTYGTIGMVNSDKATVTRKPGSNTFAIGTPDGVGLMGGSFERGQLVTTVHNDSMTEQDVRNREAHGATTEELMKDFLVGQASLLEKLIAQTT